MADKLDLLQGTLDVMVLRRCLRSAPCMDMGSRAGSNRPAVMRCC